MLVLYTKYYQDDVIGDEIGVNVNRTRRNEKCVHIAT
jgi:sRNA-binding carbon storage regulator CsrA